MSTSEKGIGIAAIIMAVCCAVLPLAGGALAGGLLSAAARSASSWATPSSPVLASSCAGATAADAAASRARNGEWCGHRAWVLFV